MPDPGNTSPGLRRPHVVLDVASRQWKARKIERLLELEAAGGALRLLEVGTGSGAIAHYFANREPVGFEVDAVDVCDSRLVSDGYRFALVSGTDLPFPDQSFDFVLSNHVIEHVGDRGAQLAHLRELRRVLKRGGRGYLAVPNRWMLVEPHYRIAFLSWLPAPWRSRYLELRSGVGFYDCEPLETSELEALFGGAGLSAASRVTEALRLTLEIESPHSLLARIVRWIPDGVWNSVRKVMPTHIYTFECSDG